MRLSLLNQGQLIRIYMYQSLMFNELKWKYRKQLFLSITERTKEAMWLLVAFVTSMATIAYFGAHFIVYIAMNHYK